MSAPTMIDHSASSDLAVIGMACRLPGANDVAALWQNLCHGVESITFFTDEELLAAGEDPKLIHDPDYVKARPILAGVEMFDAAFFGFTPREAEILDPQQRLFLECAWEALEDAGYDTDRYEGAISLYAGTSFSNYLVKNLYGNRPVMEAFGDFESAICNMQDSLATRVAYKLNLKGAACSVQTFCSTSLVSVHLASQSLLNYESDMALAGGVTVYVPQESGYVYGEGGIVSPDGRCRTFDSSGRGTVFGNGSGVVVLKRMEDALADGDRIHAVVRGSAVNNDGSLKVSYGAPSVVGQTEVIVEALAAAGVDPDTIGYVEAHGTATVLGDPAEIAALTQAFRTKTDRKGFCGVGSIKTNVGHLDAAAGVAGLIKAVLCLKHGMIPPSLHFEAPNPEIDFQESPFYVNTELKEWQQNGAPRRAGVSAFGIGGTNAHVILEEAPSAESPPASWPEQVVLLSARSASALEEMTTNLAGYLTGRDDMSLSDVAHTLQVGRRQFSHRRILVCSSIGEAARKLERGDPSRLRTEHQERRNRSVVFMFPAQWDEETSKGCELFRRQGRFRDEALRCCEILQRECGVDAVALFEGRDRESAPAGKDRDDRGVERAALFVLEYALAKQWSEWGVEPETMIAEGVGVQVASTLAQLVSLEDALRAVVGQKDTPDAVRPPTVLISDPEGGWRPATDRADDDEISDGCGEGRHDPRSRSIGTLLGDSRRVFLEVGPGRSFASLVEQCAVQDRRITAIPSMHGLDERDEGAGLLEALGRLWLGGVEIDWRRLHANETRRRVSLPTYPFERKRFWIEPLQGEEPPAEPVASEAAAEPDPKGWIYHPLWKASLTPPRSAPDSAEGDRYLIFADTTGLGRQLADALRSCGSDVISVEAGEALSGDPESGYVIEPTRQREYGDLVEDLRARHRLPNRVLHLWSVDSVVTPPGEVDRLEDVSNLGFYSVLYLMQALGAELKEQQLTIKVLSTGLHEVVGGEVLSPWKAGILALCRIFPQEHGNVGCCSIDIEPLDEHVQPLRMVADRLLPELWSDNTPRVVAYRGGKRWIQTLERVDVDRFAERQPRLREEGTYLITGGLGNVGYVFAAHLAKTVQARLVLTARSQLPSRNEWDQWLSAHGEKDQTGLKIKRIRALEAMGAEVLFASADVADPVHMKRVLDETHRRFGAVHGVIHAAGVLTPDTFSPIQQLSRATCEKQLRPKVYGLGVLNTLLGSEKLDFFLLTSSLSTLLGGIGYCAYGAANLIMDAFASHKRQRAETPWLSVNWDHWRFSDEGPSSQALEATAGQRALDPEDGTTVFDYVLRLVDLPQIVVATGDLYGRIARWIAANGDRPEASGAGAAGRHERPDVPSEYSEPTTNEEVVLAGIWSELLGIDRIGIHDNFFELGGHSLFAARMLARVRESFDVPLPLDAVFEAPTVAELSRRVLAVQWARKSREAGQANAELDREEVAL